MKAKDCEPRIIERYPEKTLDVDERLKGNQLVTLGFNRETTIAEAGRCLGYIRCESCDLCQLFCPDSCITRSEETGQIEIDYDVCRGCAICAAVCPKGAIKMVLTEE